MMEDKSVSRKELLKAIVQGVIGGALLGAAFAGGYLYRDMVDQPPASEASFELLQEADGQLAEHFLWELPDETTRVHGAVAGLMMSLDDPYTFFVEPQSAEVDATNLAGVFGGIGAEIARNEEGYYVIARAYPGNPAEQAGVHAGDIILAVDDREITPETPETELIALVRGEVGTTVVLTLRRNEETLLIEVIRAEVLIPSVIWELMDADPRVGYIRITRFTERSPEEVGQAIEELRSDGAHALILDLRNNGGGLVDSAVGVTSEFVSGGVVLYEERQGEPEKVFNAARGGAALDLSLVVLVNGQTASASEIVAGALQDRERATLIGEPTFGKGSVQLIITLSDGSSIHVTNAQWFTPSRTPLEGHGLTPDVLVETAEGVDAQLAAALEHLGESLSLAEVADRPTPRFTPSIPGREILNV